MTNKEVIENYNTEQWVMEELMFDLLHEFMDKANISRGSLRFNMVGFIKEFMKQEALCDVEYAEKSKIASLESKEIITVESEDIRMVE